MRVHVYWNRTRKRFSVRDAKTRRVIDHQAYLSLANVRFTVSEAGRQRTLRQGQRNVHAWVEGDLIDYVYSDGDRVAYDPFKFPYFYSVKSGRCVQSAATATFSGGRVWVSSTST